MVAVRPATLKENGLEDDYYANLGGVRQVIAMRIGLRYRDAVPRNANRFLR